MRQDEERHARRPRAERRLRLRREERTDPRLGAEELGDGMGGGAAHGTGLRLGDEAAIPAARAGAVVPAGLRAVAVGGLRAVAIGGVRAVAKGGLRAVAKAGLRGVAPDERRLERRDGGHRGLLRGSGVDQDHGSQPRRSGRPFASGTTPWNTPRLFW